MSAFREPELLSDSHVFSHFDSGKPELDMFLSQLALSSQREGFARTFVVCDADRNVTGYYALCGGSVSRSSAPRQIAGHGSPRELPVVLLARLAIDRKHQGQGLGTMLMHHAFRSSLAAAETVSFRALMVHALDEEASEFYVKFGFRPAKGVERVLFISLSDVARIVEDARFTDE